MLNKSLLVALVMLISTALVAQDKKEEEKKPVGYQFTETINVPHTSVKNQYRSGTCWSFSGLSLIEAEMMRKGKPATDLSEMFIVYHSYFGKAQRYVRMHGEMNFAAGGGFPDITNVMRTHGMVPDTFYTGIQYDQPNHVHGEMDDLLTSMVNSVIKNKNKKLTTVWPQAIEGALDAYLGEIPETFTYEGKEYTPQTFVTDYMDINPDDYIMVTSFNHHPFYKPFVLEVQDNWACDMMYNLPLEEMMEVIDACLEAGYTIAWASDVSEKGFSWTNGVAVVPETEIKSMSGLEQDKWETVSEQDRMKQLYSFDEPRTEKEITQELRQLAFDNYQTTDDHGMLIVGKAVDQNGNEYYKVKNSWGTDQKYDGYFYASKAFVAYKTTDIMINKEALPKAIRKKLNL